MLILVSEVVVLSEVVVPDAAAMVDDGSNKGLVGTGATETENEKKKKKSIVMWLGS